MRHLGYPIHHCPTCIPSHLHLC